MRNFFLDLLKTLLREFLPVRIISLDFSIHIDILETNTPSSDPLELDFKMKVDVEDMKILSQEGVKISEITSIEDSSMDISNLDLSKVLTLETVEIDDLKFISNISEISFLESQVKIRVLDTTEILNIPIVRYPKILLSPKIKLKFTKFLNLLSLKLEDVEILGIFEDVPIENARKIEIRDGKLLIYLRKFESVGIVDLVIAKVKKSGKIIFMPTGF